MTTIPDSSLAIKRRTFLPIDDPEDVSTYAYVRKGVCMFVTLLAKHLPQGNELQVAQDICVIEGVNWKDAVFYVLETNLSPGLKSNLHEYTNSFIIWRLKLGPIRSVNPKRDAFTATERTVIAVSRHYYVRLEEREEIPPEALELLGKELETRDIHLEPLFTE